MRRIIVEIALLCCIAFVMAGCATKNISLDDLQETHLIDLDIPIIYDTRLDPAPLTEKQIKSIIKQAGPLTPKGQTFWYIHVRCNRRVEPDYNVIVYFTPQISTKRLRKGKCLWLSEDSESFRKWIEKLQPDIKLPEPALGNYWQVSLKDKPFGKDLLPPKKRLWPFQVHGKFTDAEILAITDVVRAKLPHVRPFSDANEPIYKITRNSDGTIEVLTGTYQHWLAGWGHGFYIVEQKKRFSVVRYWHWMS